MMRRTSPDRFQEKVAQHREFFEKKRGNLLVFAEFSEGRTPCEYSVEGQGKRLSEEFLREKAFDLGIQEVHRAMAHAVDHERIGDDCIPGILPAHWGSGFKHAVISGGDVVFEIGTAYDTGPVVRVWGDLDRLYFDPGNRWVSILLQYWKGIESVFPASKDLLVTPFMYKSPLDLANGLRGNDLFTDLYTHPRQVDALLDFCAESEITLDRYLRSQIPILNESIGGVAGAALGQKTMWLNGDPVDLVSIELGERFNRPSVEMMADYADAVWFHHHSIGHTRALSISWIEGLSVQNIEQDPNGPRLMDVVMDDALLPDLIEASVRVPLDLSFNLAEALEPKRVVERLKEGRFILHAQTQTLEECRKIVEMAKRISN